MGPPCPPASWAQLLKPRAPGRRLGGTQGRQQQGPEAWRPPRGPSRSRWPSDRERPWGSKGKGWPRTPLPKKGLNLARPQRPPTPRGQNFPSAWQVRGWREGGGRQRKGRERKGGGGKRGKGREREGHAREGRKDGRGAPPQPGNQSAQVEFPCPSPVTGASPGAKEREGVANSPAPSPGVRRVRAQVPPALPPRPHCRAAPVENVGSWPGWTWTVWERLGAPSTEPRSRRPPSRADTPPARAETFWGRGPAGQSPRNPAPSGSGTKGTNPTNTHARGLPGGQEKPQPPESPLETPNVHPEARS